MTIYNKMKEVINCLALGKQPSLKTVLNLWKTFDYPSSYDFDEAVEKERIAQKDYELEQEYKHEQNEEFVEDLIEEEE